jgi:hypothetical protein
MPVNAKRGELLKAISEKLGSNYDAVGEKTHFHRECQPIFLP